MISPRRETRKFMNRPYRARRLAFCRPKRTEVVFTFQNLTGFVHSARIQSPRQTIQHGWKTGRAAERD